MPVKTARASAPMEPQPIRKFRKIDGERVEPSTGYYNEQHDTSFVNVEGSAVMQAYRGDVFKPVDITSAVLMGMNRTKELHNNYERWQYAFANFGTDPALTRVEKPKNRHYLNSDGRPKRRKNKIVGKVHWCQLQGDDTWGNHEATAQLFRDRSKRAKLERGGNTRHDGKGIYLAYEKYPDPWSATLSEQRALEGYEDRVRPPTVVELLRPVLKKGRVFRYSSDAVPITRAVSKPVRVEPTWDHSPVERQDLSKYGSPANEPLRSDPIPSEMAGDIVERPKVYYTPGIDIPTGQRPLKMLQNFEKDIEDGSHVSTWELDYLRFYHESPRDFDAARYMSWMSCPEIMRNALLTDRYNHHTATKAVERAFDKKFPVNAMNDANPEDDSHLLNLYWEKVRKGLDKEQSYQHALLMRTTSNGRMRKFKPLHFPKDMSARERAHELVWYRWYTGKITTAKYKSLLRSFSGESAPKSDCKSLVVVSDAWERYTREEKQFMMTLGIPPWSISFTAWAGRRNVLAPMTDMEYEAVTRPQWSGEAKILEGEYFPKGDPVVSSFTFDEAKIESFSAFDYDPVLVDKAGWRAMSAIQRQRIKNFTDQIVPIKDSYRLDEESGIILPNFNSKQLAKIIEHVSQ